MNSLAMNSNFEEVPMTPSHKPATKKVVVVSITMKWHIASKKKYINNHLTLLVVH